MGQRPGPVRDPEVGRQVISCKTDLRLELDPLPELGRETVPRGSDRPGLATDRPGSATDRRVSATDRRVSVIGHRVSATDPRELDDHPDRGLRDCDRQGMDLANGHRETGHRDTGHRDKDLRVTDLQVTVHLTPVICRIMVAGTGTTALTTGGPGQPLVP